VNSTAADHRPLAVPLRPVSTVEALAEALRDDIVSGVLAPGEVVREADLADLFGVSRHSVRLAAQGLVHDGLLRHEPRRGLSVARLTADDAADIFRLRIALEVEAARLLALGSGGLERCRAGLAALEAVPPEADWRQVRDADLGFHRGLVDGLGSERARRTFASLLCQLRLSFVPIRGDFEDRDEIVRQHREMFESIEAGQPVRAADLVRAHLEDALERILVVLHRDRTAQQFNR